MVAFDNNHDQNLKTLLENVSLPAGRSAKEDLEGALENIFNHPNVGPFVSRQLIQHLVTSNPTPGYVARVASVFSDNGSGHRGDLKAVVKAILLDPEARAGDGPLPPPQSGNPTRPVSIGPAPAQQGNERASATSRPDRARRSGVAAPVASAGHLKEPVLFIAGLLRALGASVDETNVLANYSAQMGQNLFYAPSVFSYFSPDYQVPGTKLLGPEFQVFSTSTAIIRANFVNSLVFGSVGKGTQVDLSPFAAINPQDLIAALDTLFMNGQMPPEMRDSVLTAVNAADSTKLKAQTALYLVATSALYQVTN
jgi:uncharacterized protein (DUF1800 family)